MRNAIKFFGPLAVTFVVLLGVAVGTARFFTWADREEPLNAEFVARADGIRMYRTPAPGGWVYFVQGYYRGETSAVFVPGEK